ncbi:MAG: hypothetical protein IPM30_14870 [Burkholderiales bacterium]|nr:hypothetical protein [Burkholderiales bacterium]
MARAGGIKINVSADGFAARDVRVHPLLLRKCTRYAKSANVGRQMKRRQGGNSLAGALIGLFLVVYWISTSKGCSGSKPPVVPPVSTMQEKPGGEEAALKNAAAPRDSRAPTMECINAQQTLRNIEYSINQSGEADSRLVSELNAAIKLLADLGCPSSQVLNAALDRRLEDARSIVESSRRQSARSYVEGHEAALNEVSSMLDCRVVYQDGMRFLFVTGTDETGTYAINGTARTVAARMGWIDGARKFSPEQMQQLLKIGLAKCQR